jgi:hypothetical protein
MGYYSTKQKIILVAVKMKIFSIYFFDQNVHIYLLVENLSEEPYLKLKLHNQYVKRLLALVRLDAVKSMLDLKSFKHYKLK